MNKTSKLVPILALTLVLQACGGGGDSAPASSSGPQAAAKAMLAKAKPGPLAQSMSIEPAEQARQLFMYAESGLAMFFPGPKPEFQYGPLLVRFYPETGNYLGVVVQPDAGYEYLHVYVLGAVSGNQLIDVGPLTNYIRPVDPNPQPSAGNGCMDFALMDTEGTQIVTSYAMSGDGTGQMTNTLVIGGMETFEGKPARRSVTTSSISTTTSEGLLNSQGTLTGFGVLRGTTFMTYGLDEVKTMTFNGPALNVAVATTTHTVFDPASVDRTYTLAPGTAINEADYRTETTTTHTTGASATPVDQTQTQKSSGSRTVKFVGMEQVSVPAGTFNACKYETTYQAGDGVLVTQWFAAGKGVLLKDTTIAPGAAAQTTQATGVTINGTPL